jgi:microcystin-dependent protein
MFAGNFAPLGWMFCQGQLLPISENETLFQLIGTTYGGDGQSTFALPDMQSRVPIHQGNGFALAQTGGVEEITLTVQQIPIHTHAALCSINTSTGTSPTNTVLAAPPDVNTLPYGTDAPVGALNAASINAVGGSQPHSNLQPYNCLNYIISLFGIFPSQT